MINCQLKKFPWLMKVIISNSILIWSSILVADDVKFNGTFEYYIADYFKQGKSEDRFYLLVDSKIDQEDLTEPQRLRIYPMAQINLRQFKTGEKIQVVVQTVDEEDSGIKLVAGEQAIHVKKVEALALDSN